METRTLWREVAVTTPPLTLLLTLQTPQDLKRLYVQAGVQRKESVFLFSDTQIVEESFLEDINGMLSTGEVPNLYSPDEMGEIREGITQAARAAGVEETSDALYNFFIEQARVISTVCVAFMSRICH